LRGRVEALPNSLIDDTAGTGDTGKVWSADKSATENSSLIGAITSKYTKPSDGIPASDLASGVIPSVPVTDVQVNGTSVLNQGVANVPIADTNTPGVAKVNSQNGIGLSSSKTLIIIRASTDEIKAENANYKVITPYNISPATFYGLAKAAGDSTQSSSSNAVGVYTDAAKQKIQNMLGITSLLSTEESATATAAHAINSTFMMSGKLHRATAAIAIGDAVEVGTNCEVVKADEVFVKNTDIATTNTPGIIYTESGAGLAINNNGKIFVVEATESQIKVGTN